MFDDMTAEEQLGALATVDMIRLMAMSMASDILDEFKVSVLAKIESIQFDPKFEVELNSSLTFATSKSTREPDLYD